MPGFNFDTILFLIQITILLRIALISYIGLLCSNVKPRTVVPKFFFCFFFFYHERVPGELLPILRKPYEHFIGLKHCGVGQRKQMFSSYQASLNELKIMPSTYSLHVQLKEIFSDHNIDNFRVCAQ